MLRLLKRSLNFIFVLIAVFMATRAMVRTLPGDPVETLIAESGTSISEATLRHELGLDRPFWVAFADDLKRWSHGDLGTSLLSKKPIRPVLIQRFKKTLELAAIAAWMTAVLSLGIGLIAAAHPGRLADRFCTFYGALSAALPIPWIGPVLLLVFAVWLPVFPVGGHPLLPALALASHLSGVWARLVRERVRESLRYGAASGARARGIPEWKVLFKYGFLPVGGSLIAYFGTQLGSLLSGAWVVEVIFDWRGMGSLLVEAVLKRDYPVVEAATFLAATMSLLGTFLGDWAQGRLDPRIHEAEKP